MNPGKAVWMRWWYAVFQFENVWIIKMQVIFRQLRKQKLSIKSLEFEKAIHETWLVLYFWENYMMLLRYCC